jgi:hypothetical protein
MRHNGIPNESELAMVAAMIFGYMPQTTNRVVGSVEIAREILAESHRKVREMEAAEEAAEKDS